jgi:uncharacterized membrane protein
MVKVYQFSPDGISTPHGIIAGTWIQIGGDITPGGTCGQSVSVTRSGTLISVAVGCPGAQEVHVYDFIGGVWTLRGSPITSPASKLGYSVSLSEDGETVAGGAYLNDLGGPNSGAVGVYNWNGVAWVQLGGDILGEGSADASGWSVSLNEAGTIISIGARYNDGGGSQSGHVRVYEYNGSSWIQRGTDIDGVAAGNEFGYSASINATGDTFIGGAPAAGPNDGLTRVFVWSGSSWSQKGQLILGEAINDYSGFSVTINDTADRIAIGARGNDGNGNSSGHTRVFEWVPD